MFRTCFSVVLVIALFSSSIFAMGSDHREGDLPPHEGWIAGTHEAVNLPCRVHGYWINASDTLFYKDGNAVLEKMLERLSSIQGLTVRVILHAEKGVAKSPWSDKALDSADWSVTIAGKEAVTPKQDEVTVDVWIGGNLSLQDLKIPLAVKVESGNEIESFLERRNAETKK